MPRKARRLLWTQAACYHVINRGHNRETVFADDDDRRFFLQLLGRYRDRFFHYCLMSNHFHLLLRLVDPRLLSPLMAGLLGSYVHYFNRRYRFVGHLWQGRFKSPAIEMETYLLSCGRYIERNPLGPGLVDEPWDYPWSSCAAYAKGDADPLLTENPYYLELAKTPARRRKLWQRFLLDEDPKERVIASDEWLLGTNTFRNEAHHSRPIGRRRGRPRKSQGTFSS